MRKTTGDACKKGCCGAAGGEWVVLCGNKMAPRKCFQFVVRGSWVKVGWVEVAGPRPWRAGSV